MNTGSDLDLVIRLHDDDIKAFDALYCKYHQALYANILKLTKNPEAAQDILQDVFCVLWEKRVSIDDQQSVSGWLFVLSFNRSVNYLRKKVRESTAKGSITTLGVSDEDGPNVLEDQYHLLESAILQLSPQKRKVFTLCKLEGKSYDAATKEMNISKHTVKEYLSSAMASVKSFIKEHKGYSETITILFILNQWLGK